MTRKPWHPLRSSTYSHKFAQHAASVRIPIISFKITNVYLEVAYSLKNVFDTLPSSLRRTGLLQTSLFVDVFFTLNKSWITKKEERKRTVLLSLLHTCVHTLAGCNDDNKLWLWFIYYHEFEMLIRSHLEGIPI